LAEHAVISRTPLARGLKQVNTDMMSVGTRYASRRKCRGELGADVAQGKDVLAGGCI